LRGESTESYYLDPESLSDAEEEELRLAMVSIKDLQKVIRTNFSTM
jgi:signal-transduction protein with cAMP-binding, CBS, and nucleotidyltransferase domain